MATEEVAMPYRLGAVERAMKVQEVIVRAIAGQLSWRTSDHLEPNRDFLAERYALFSPAS
jgi:hypothetical protein